MRFMKAQYINFAKYLSILFLLLSLIVSVYLSLIILFKEDKITNIPNQDYNIFTICACAFTLGVYWNYGYIRKIGSI